MRSEILFMSCQEGRKTESRLGWEDTSAAEEKRKRCSTPPHKEFNPRKELMSDVELLAVRPWPSDHVWREFHFQKVENFQKMLQDKEFSENFWT